MSTKKNIDRICDQLGSLKENKFYLELENVEISRHIIKKESLKNITLTEHIEGIRISGKQQETEFA